MKVVNFMLKENIVHNILKKLQIVIKDITVQVGVPIIEYYVQMDILLLQEGNQSQIAFHVIRVLFANKERLFQV